MVVASERGLLDNQFGIIVLITDKGTLLPMDNCTILVDIAQDASFMFTIYRESVGGFVFFH